VGYFTALRERSHPNPREKFQAFTQELQAGFNRERLLDWHETEMKDWSRFGKVRQALEKWLRDPDDVFIHARERKEELARQRKKRTRKR